MHRVTRLDRAQMTVPERFARHSGGFRRQPLVDGTAGSVHMGFAACELEAGGHIEPHVQSYEEAVYVLDGELELTMNGERIRLGKDEGGLIPVGVLHAWRNPGTQLSTWVEMVAPRPRGDRDPADIFFQPQAPATGTARRVDARDPRCRQFFHFEPGQMDLDSARRGSRVDAPVVSPSMLTALLVYSGIGIKMLVDQRQDANLFTMFMVEYEPGGVAHPHDHPLEEAYLILDGEVDAVADGQTYRLQAGDCFWTGVGTIHAFYNRSAQKVRWLETQAPQPPRNHSYRFNREWEYLGQLLAAGRASAGGASQQ
ncbi:MAG: cupin domain-containing protein [Armatimonadota bacterium]|nr:cupin domain-containing protein [Armatimonadota bacterium]MDR7486799.1 cupin domain-containing protein [Armatimonadota bacterium]MDR7533862.1 cupin domain-containing protein [Armatimonadota bacterium]MDR7535110.1 cupin domain-containing protein [Armatimonadota bacterium]